MKPTAGHLRRLDGPPARVARMSPDGILAARQAASAAGLHHVTDGGPGIRRRSRGKGFAYLGTDGKPLRDEPTLARIRALAIPPAWTEVWICPNPRGHLQASGRDAKGRKQYRYHAQWNRERNDGKFDRIVEFGAAFSAKDFRTWGGTLAAFQRFARTTLPYKADGSLAGDRALAALENAVVREVALALGNTPSVCRKSYIDPVVFSGWREGRVQRAAATCRGERQWESATLRFLRKAHR